MEVRVKCVRQRTSVDGKRFGKLALVRILGVMSNRAAPLASLSSHPASLPHPLEAWLAALVPLAARPASPRDVSSRFFFGPTPRRAGALVTPNSIPCPPARHEGQLLLGLMKRQH